MSFTPITDEVKAEKVLLDKLSCMPLTDLHICAGDDDHAPHIDLTFGDMTLNIIHGELGMVAILSQKKPDVTAGKDFHHSPGVLQ